MTTAIDAHAHVIVPELLRRAAPAETWRPAVSREQGHQVIELEGRRIGSAVSEFVELEQILAALEQLEIGRVLLCPWVPLLFYGAEPEEGLRRCRLQNDGLARLRAARPDRVSVLGAVPLQDPELAASELATVMTDGTFAGVEVTASVNGDYLGDERFEPFWAAAQRLDALVFVHPTTRGFPLDVFQRNYLWNLVGNPFETTIAAADLLLGGTIDRYPALRVLLAHGGGAIVALSGRLRHGQRAVAAAAPVGVAPAEVAEHFLFDTITHDPRLLRSLIDAVGAERVLLGSDYPFDMADPDPVATVRAAGLDADSERAVLWANAARELRLQSGSDVG